AGARGQGGSPRFSAHMTHVANVLKALRAATGISDSIEAPCWLYQGDAPQPEGLLACKNGLLDLERGELLPHTPDFFNLNATKVEFDPVAQAPHFEEFIKSIWPSDQGAINFLQEWFGNVLTPNMKSQKAFFMVAPKRGGKGTIAKVIAELVGSE